jgi:hypothetical protein
VINCQFCGKGKVLLQIQLNSDANDADLCPMLDNKNLKKLTLIGLILASGTIASMYLAKRVRPGTLISTKTSTADVTTQR